MRRVRCANGGGVSKIQCPGDQRQLPIMFSLLSLSYLLCPPTEVHDLLVAPVFPKGQEAAVWKCPAGSQQCCVRPEPTRHCIRAGVIMHLEAALLETTSEIVCLFQKNAYSLSTI